MDQNTRDRLRRLVGQLIDAQYDLGRREALGDVTGPELAELTEEADALADQMRSAIDNL